MTYIDTLPRRVVHVVHGLIVANREANQPSTASEVCIYDWSALTVNATSKALARARACGLAINAGRYWIPTNFALDNASGFERRSLDDEDARYGEGFVSAAPRPGWHPDD